MMLMQVDLQMVGSLAGQEDQAGWTVWDVDKAQTNNLITKSIEGIGITINTNGGGWVSARGGNAEGRGGDITGTSWDDVVEDFAISRNGNGSATMAFTNLNSALTYTLTAHHNDPYTLNSGFSGRTQTPSITTGTVFGEADAGFITNLRLGSRADSAFNPSMIRFTPDGSGKASIRFTSSADFVLLNGFELYAVPEPSHFVLLSSALALGLVMIRRRR